MADFYLQHQNKKPKQDMGNVFFSVTKKKLKMHLAMLNTEDSKCVTQYHAKRASLDFPCEETLP